MESNQLSALDLAIEKAKKENKIVIYRQFGDDYNCDITYENFYYHKYTTINNFCKEFYKICKKIGKPYECRGDGFTCEFTDHFSNDHFYARINSFVDMYVTNFPNNIDISNYEDYIEKYFDNKTQKNECE